MDSNFGVVDSINEKGFGFIKSDNYSKNIFFHASSVKGGHFNDLTKGDEVEFDEPITNEKGFATKSVYIK